MVHACNLSTFERLRQEDGDFKTSLGCIASPDLSRQTNSFLKNNVHDLKPKVKAVPDPEFPSCQRSCWQSLLRSPSHLLSGGCCAAHCPDLWVSMWGRALLCGKNKEGLS